MQNAKVSVVVPVYNGERTLKHCLDSLINLDYPKKDLEIIIIDNGSTDRTKEIARRYPVRYVYESQRNRAKARNRGVEIAHGEFIAFIDADCVAHKDWIRNLLKACYDSGVGGCGGNILSFRPFSLWEKFAENKGFFRQECFMERETLFPGLRTNNAIYPKSVLKSVGLFDEAFYTVEDQELSLRVALSGLKLIYIPDAIVFHKHKSSFIGLCKQFFGYGRYTRVLYEKYKALMTLRYHIMFKDIFHDDGYLRSSCDDGRCAKILFSIIGTFISLVYLAGWLSFSIFGRMCAKPTPARSSLPDRVFRKLGEELIISDVSKECNYSLGVVGTRIYELLVRGKTEPEIIEKLSGEYFVNEDELKRDFTEFINELKKEKLFNHTL